MHVFMSWAGAVSVINGNRVYRNGLGVDKQIVGAPFQLIKSNALISALVVSVVVLK